MFLVYWNRGMYDLGLNGFFVNDWLDSLMHMVMHMLAGHSWCSSSRSCCLVCDAAILKLSKLLFMSGSILLGIAMMNDLLDLWSKVMRMLFR